jgi:threonine aldolase
MGACYSLEELRAWRKYTRAKKIMLHIDGARLANAASFLKCSLRDITSEIGVDVVSMGGTKNGLMGAEAVLLFTPEAKESFKFYRKQAMQLPSKTRFLAAQFYAYLKDDLWLEIADQVTSGARDLAERLKQFPEIGQPFAVQSNGLFVAVPKAWVSPLREKFFFYVWDAHYSADTQLCRWMISFDWQAEMTARFIECIHEVKRCSPVK